MGYLRTDDVNGFQQEGFRPYDMNVDRGERASTAHAYVNPARSRPNLTVRTKTTPWRIVVEGTRAVGVEIDRGNGPRVLRVEREVIVAASAFSSPHLLMLSGISPAEHLRENGIDVVHDLPGVGANLHDHLEVHVQWGGELQLSRNRHAWPGGGDQRDTRQRDLFARRRPENPTDRPAPCLHRGEVLP